MTKSTSNKPMIPVVGRIYHMFDDGKITYARHNLVRCKQVIKLTDFKKHRMYDAWKEAVSEHDWIFNPETPCIVVCEYLDRDNNDEDVPSELYYSMTWGGGWFGFGTPMDDGTLDVRGTAWDSVISRVLNGECNYSKSEIAEIMEDDRKVKEQDSEII